MDKSLFLYIHFTLLFMLSVFTSVAIAKTSISTDQKALLAIRDHISFGPNNVFVTNWSAESPVCNWIGVTCGSRHYRVRELNISKMDLHGTIPPQVGNISFLVVLDLSGNNFNGDLPHELAGLHRLKVLNLSANALTGGIPFWIHRLNQLEYLYLSNNSFSGSIPTSISNMSNLKVLFLDLNQLSGSIPFGIFNISSLKRVSFSYNFLSGELPDSMCFGLQKLNTLSLSHNSLHGSVLSAVSQCLQLQELFLGYNNFSGLMPKELCNLKGLEVLELPANMFQGIIPEEIGNLTKLRHLALYNNNLTGAIPTQIGNLKMLTYLGLATNQLTGFLPKEIGNLTVLTELNLGVNNLRGAIPMELEKLDKLEILNLENNSFSGSIPEGIFNISTMRIIGLSINYLSGKLPSTMGYGLPNLEEYSMAFNEVNGVLPPSISNSSKLRTLQLTKNHFSGTIPFSFGNLGSLEELNLGSNELTKDSSALKMEFLTTLSNCNLSTLDLSYNPLNGILPESIGNVSKTIQQLFLDGCGISGHIPVELGNLTTLVRLTLNDNQLTGSLPKSFISMQMLQRVSFARNRLSGLISNNLCAFQSLGELYLSENMFSGPIPECIGNITSLRKLSLDSNRWSSVIPASLWNLKDLLVLDLSSNFLIGLLPDEVANLRVATSMNLAMNNLAGDLPNTIGNLQNLQYYSVAHNNFEGNIPDSVGNMLALETLDLSQNKFAGTIPLSLEKLQYLKHFNVSYNNFSGPIPSKGPFENFSSESFIFNKALCGEQRFQVPPCHDLAPRKSWAKDPHHILLLSLVIPTFIVASALGVVYLIYRKKATISVKDELSSLASRKRISYYELQQATQGYDERNLIGQGSFGSVYKGTLRDGQVIAIKVFNLHIERALKSFDVECQVLRNLRHRNITRVISSCSNEEFRALVLEYMPNGNLENWVHSENHFLKLMERLSIMIDVACALQYLHSENSVPVVHSDLKPSNVLIDRDMVGHVSDFGIAKILVEESIDYTNTLATFGYIAPEYGSEGLVSTKCDVYSYGIMLMEVFTRKRPNDVMFDGDMSLKDWVNQSIENALPEIIDDGLMQRVEEEHHALIMECLSRIMHVALNCAQEAPKERSNIGDVLASLNKNSSFLKFFECY